MRIVDRKTFLTLPAGTVYAKIAEPIIIGGLSVKGDSIRDIDWATLDIANWQSNDSGDWSDRYYQMAEGNISVPCDDMYGRDGMFDAKDQFLIFEKGDLLVLRAIVDEALTLPDLPAPSKVLTRAA
jgi:hypothetical protein